ncbi:hypothetical protein LTR85_007984 [Meristemomyces frigidus]|nr:hypothetical protein LTR85_007984 [Meristemomyces frigidus]
MASIKTCVTCTETVTVPCRSCGDVNYCSWECETADKVSHQLLCSTFKTPEVQQRPADGMCRVLFFPKDDDKPRVIWLKVVDDYFGLKPDMDDIMDGRTYRPEEIDENPLTGVKLDHRIHLCYVDDFASYGKINMAVVETANRMCKPWMGPILAYCGKVSEDEEGNDFVGEMMDMDMTDYSTVSQYFIAARRDFAERAKVVGPKVQAVKVLCDGEREANDCLRLQPFTAPRFHPQFHTEGHVSTISTLVGMPLKLTKWKDTRELNPRNDFIGLKGPGYIPVQDSNTGTVLIFREDLAPLKVGTVDVFRSFCEHAMDRALDEMTAQKWNEFLTARVG